jgi:predicted nucleic acid-binding protein
MIAVDTNVLIYSLDQHDQAKRTKARELLRQLHTQDEDVVLLWQVACEFMRYLRSL